MNPQSPSLQSALHQKNQNSQSSINRILPQLSELGNILWRHLSETNKIKALPYNPNHPSIQQQTLKTLSLATAQLSLISRQFMVQNNLDVDNTYNLVPASLPILEREEGEGGLLQSITHGRVVDSQFSQMLPDYLRTRPMPEVETMCDEMVKNVEILENNSKFTKQHNGICEEVLAVLRDDNRFLNRKTKREGANEDNGDTAIKTDGGHFDSAESNTGPGAEIMKRKLFNLVNEVYQTNIKI